MQMQRGFINVGILIAILVGVAVLGGGAYYVVQQQAPTQTATENFDNLQQLPTTNTSVKTTQTQNTETQKATATIDKNSLTSSSPTPTITGTANSDIGIFIAKGTVTAGTTISTDWHNYAWRYWGHLGKCQSTTGDFCGFDILDGRWSIKVFGPGFELEPGTYTVIITDSITGKDNANVLATGILTVKSTAAAPTIPNILFSHPTDGYNFTYNANKLEARATSATEFPSGTGLLPSSAVFSGGGYGQEAEILTYRGSIDAAQEAFIGAYRQYYSPQVLGTENVTINGNQARVVRYKVGPTYPEAKVYLIAYRPNEPRTIVATGDYSVIATIKNQ